MLARPGLQLDLLFSTVSTPTSDTHFFIIAFKLEARPIDLLACGGSLMDQTLAFRSAGCTPSPASGKRV